MFSPPFVLYQPIKSVSKLIGLFLLLLQPFFFMSSTHAATAPYLRSIQENFDNWVTDTQSKYYFPAYTYAGNTTYATVAIKAPKDGWFSSAYGQETNPLSTFTYTSSPQYFFEYHIAGRLNTAPNKKVLELNGTSPNAIWKNGLCLVQGEPYTLSYWHGYRSWDLASGSNNQQIAIVLTRLNTDGSVTNNETTLAWDLLTGTGAPTSYDATSVAQSPNPDFMGQDGNWHTGNRITKSGNIPVASGIYRFSVKVISPNTGTGNWFDDVSLNLDANADTSACDALTQCSASSPSWNPDTSACEKCSPPTPYWDAINKVCTSTTPPPAKATLIKQTRPL
jgi:hypothetical protein